MSNTSGSNNQKLPPTSEFGRYWVEGTLLIVAVIFLIAPSQIDVGAPEAASVEDHEVSAEPRRGIMTDPPVIFLHSFDRDCMDCHRIFKSAGKRRAELQQHQNIVLDHGMNDRCVDCHAQEDRNQLRGQGTELISFANSQDLCARCHGTTFRDWQSGMHGRTTGSWNTKDPRHSKLTCVECHEPHHPAYEAYEPLPGPNTRGMNPNSDVKAAGHGPANPLRIDYNPAGVGHE